MSGFSSAQLRKLMGKLDRMHVQSRNVDGKQIDYIEGWFALSEANAIFGFSNWDRETVHFEKIFERKAGEMTTCAYLARVQIRVRVSDRTVCREGTGCGTVSARDPADAHERAIKVAETDATKRALATFGNRFGLCLYDKDQNGVTEKPGAAPLEIITPDGQVLVSGLSPEGFCSGLRQILEKAADDAECAVWWERNARQVARLREIAPQLKTQRGEHYGDVLERLFRGRLGAPAKSVAPTVPAAASQSAVVPLHPLAPSRIARGPRIDKASLTIGTARRLRDKSYTHHVATLPCLVCESMPSHAHHLTFAQPRGLSLKVSDEFVVPLCVIHHNELHQAGGELVWWKRIGINPLPIAEAMWAAAHDVGIAEDQSAANTVSVNPPASSASP
jgi:DNA recombination protein Rad52